MNPTLRELKACLDCDYEWYSRGKGRSLKCPGCGSKRTYIIESVPYEEESGNEWGTMVFLGLVTIGGVVVFWKHVLVALSFGAVGYGGYMLFRYLRWCMGRRPITRHNESQVGHKTYDIPG